MRVGGVAASMIILLAGSAALAADVVPGDGSAPSQGTQAQRKVPRRRVRARRRIA